MNQRTALYTLAAIAVLMIVILGPIFTVASRPLGQGNPTEQRQTIEAIVNPRLSATARARTTLTATYSFQSTLASSSADGTLRIWGVRSGQ